MKSLLISLFIGLSGLSVSQTVHSLSKLEGRWSYTGGTGFERWKQQGEELHGEAYRYSSLGDTLLTERMCLKKEGENLVLEIAPQTILHDSNTMLFRGCTTRRNRAAACGFFLNVTEASPYAIEYRFGFLSKRKLRYRVYYGMKSKPHTFILRKEN